MNKAKANGPTMSGKINWFRTRRLERGRALEEWSRHEKVPKVERRSRSPALRSATAAHPVRSEITHSLQTTRDGRRTLRTTVLGCSFIPRMIGSSVTGWRFGQVHGRSQFVNHPESSASAFAWHGNLTRSVVIGHLAASGIRMRGCRRNPLRCFGFDE